MTSYDAAGWSAATPTEPVDPAVVDRMLEHATRAPSAGFSQGWAFLVLDTADDVALFWERHRRRSRRPTTPGSTGCAPRRW